MWVTLAGRLCDSEYLCEGTVVGARDGFGELGTLCY